MRSKLIILSVLALSLAACTAEPDYLIGKWQAVQVSEQGDSMKLIPAEVGFHFMPNGRYSFNSTLNYKEAGRYSVQENFLVAVDTIHTNTKDRIVEIELLKADSLRLKMREGNKERQILLLKE